ncbi:hypothetical protein [Arthrobacter sp. H14-L1]|nr:hypothetical protein [Arthrobacter sp. H14-L1]MCY0906138.1 hypothetical protein [Arthrobacter sp. H14-L1]
MNQSSAQGQVDDALLTLTKAGITTRSDIVAADARTIGKAILQRAHT